MDFGAEDIGPYDPYMDFLLEHIGRMTPKKPSEEKSGRIFHFLTNNPKIKMVISTVSMPPQIKILEIPKKTVFSIRCFINT